MEKPDRRPERPRVYHFHPDARDQLTNFNSIIEFLPRINESWQLFNDLQVITHAVSDELAKLHKDYRGPGHPVGDSPLPGNSLRCHNHVATPSPLTPLAIAAPAAPLQQQRTAAAAGAAKKIEVAVNKQANLDTLRQYANKDIQVLSVNEFLTYLQRHNYVPTTGSRDRRLAGPTTPTRSVRADAEYMTFSHPHIIIEDTTKEHRTYYKEFKPDPQNRSSLPSINFDAPPGVCPFFTPALVQDRAKYHDHNRSLSDARAKKRSRVLARLEAFRKLSTSDRIIQCRRAGPFDGYCECCQDKYTDIVKHANSSKHEAFASNEDNYKTLDAMFAKIQSEAHLPRYPILEIVPQEEFLELERANFLAEMAASLAQATVPSPSPSATAADVAVDAVDDSLPLLGPVAVRRPSPPTAALFKPTGNDDQARDDVVAAGGVMLVDALDSIPVDPAVTTAAAADAAADAAAAAADAPADADMVVETEVATMELVAPNSPVLQLAPAQTPPPRRATVSPASNIFSTQQKAPKRERDDVYTPAPQVPKGRNRYTPPSTVTAPQHAGPSPVPFTSTPTPPAFSAFDFDGDENTGRHVKDAVIGPGKSSAKRARRAGGALEPAFALTQPELIAVAATPDLSESFDIPTGMMQPTRPLPPTHTHDPVVAGSSALTPKTRRHRAMFPTSTPLPIARATHI